MKIQSFAFSPRVWDKVPKQFNNAPQQHKLLADSVCFGQAKPDPDVQAARLTLQYFNKLWDEIKQAATVDTDDGKSVYISLPNGRAMTLLWQREEGSDTYTLTSYEASGDRAPNFLCYREDYISELEEDETHDFSLFGPPQPKDLEELRNEPVAIAVHGHYNGQSFAFNNSIDLNDTLLRTRPPLFPNGGQKLAAEISGFMDNLQDWIKFKLEQQGGVTVIDDGQGNKTALAFLQDLAERQGIKLPDINNDYFGKNDPTQAQMANEALDYFAQYVSEEKMGSANVSLDPEDPAKYYARFPDGTVITGRFIEDDTGSTYTLSNNDSLGDAAQTILTYRSQFLEGSDSPHITISGRLRCQPFEISHPTSEPSPDEPSRLMTDIMEFLNFAEIQFDLSANEPGEEEPEESAITPIENPTPEGKNPFKAFIDQLEQEGRI